MNDSTLPAGSFRFGDALRRGAPIRANTASSIHPSGSDRCRGMVVLSMGVTVLSLSLPPAVGRAPT